MKERYFTPENIQSKAGQMFDDLAGVKKSRRFEVKTAALLVLDMQDYFLDPASHAFIPSAPAILPNLQKLIGAFAQRQQPVVFTRHINTEQNAACMSRWWRDLICSENPHSSITPELETDSHQVLVKSQYDAFQHTDLETCLHNLGISQVLISGVMTHLCCETTARAAFMRGFDVFFAVDGTATYNEAFHRASLLNLAHGFAVPVLAADILTTLSKPSQ